MGRVIALSFLNTTFLFLYYFSFESSVVGWCCWAGEKIQDVRGSRINMTKVNLRGKEKENGIIIWYILVRKRLNHFHGSWTRTKAMFCIQGCIPSNEAPHSLCTLLLPSFHPCLAMFGCAYAFPCSFPSIYRSSSSRAITSPNFRLSFKFSDSNRRCSKSVYFILVNLLAFPGPVSNYHKKIQEDKWFFAFFFFLWFKFSGEKNRHLFLPRNRSRISANWQICWHVFRTKLQWLSWVFLQWSVNTR